MPELYVGLMSGTSLDGADAVLVDFSESKPRIVGAQSCLFAPELRAELLALNSSGANELHRGALAANAVVRCYAQVVDQLLRATGVAPVEVTALGAHGQTVRHQPQAFDGTGYTLQINQPALLAELTGIDVVADFRSRDVAAGGQGAPLVPLFHQAVWAEPGHTVTILNVGGIANLTVLAQGGSVSGFDCGPGNVLMDGWCQQHTGQAFDAGGAWAAGGAVLPGLLQDLLAEPFMQAPPPKSTGRDLFNAAWLAARLAAHTAADPRDVQATLTEFTARAAADAVLRYGAPGGQGSASLWVCGGGALNGWLLQRLSALLPAVRVASTDAIGIHPLQVEACAFAWLARKAVRREKLALQSITGARGARVLGCIYPA